MATVITDNKHYKNIAEKIRERTGQHSKYRSDALADGVEEVYQQGVRDGGGGGGTAPELPVLTNPASEADIRLNREAIDGAGNKLVGTMPEHKTVSTALTRPNNLFRVQTGYHEGCIVSVAMEGLLKAKADKDMSVFVQSPTNKFMTVVEIEPATDIYDAGFENGRSEGFAEGAHQERLEFWHFFQDGGARTNYNYAFYGTGWNDGNFYPQHSISPTAANTQGMFQTSGITNLKQRLLDCGVEMNTSGCTQLYNFAQGSSITHFPELGGSKIININNLFNGCRQLVSVDKLSLSTSASCGCTNAFNNAIELVEIRFNEVIRPMDLNMKSCTKLSKNSIESLVSSIAKDHSTTITLSATAINSAYPDRSVWTAFLAANKPANVTVTEV